MFNSKNFNRGRSEALNGVFFRAEDAVEFIRNLPVWQQISDFNEEEFRQGWNDAAQGIGDIIEDANGYAGKFDS